MPDDRSARPSVRDYGAVLLPVAGGVASWSIVLWYSGEEEYTFLLIGAVTLAVSGLVFSAAAGTGILLRERVRKDR